MRKIIIIASFITLAMQSTAQSCQDSVTITGLYRLPIMQSNTWIKSAGRTVISSVAFVKLDANPTNGYVEFNPAVSANFFLTAPTSDSAVFVAQALDGCGANIPTTATANLSKEDELATSTISTSKIFPNPATEYFVIETKEDIQDASIQLLDLNGKLQSIRVENRGNYSKKITLSYPASKGLYLLKITNGSKTEIVKINIQ